MLAGDQHQGSRADRARERELCRHAIAAGAELERHALAVVRGTFGFVGSRRESGESERLARYPEAAQREPVPRIAEVLLDRADRLWVKRYQPRTDSHMLGGWAGARGGAGCGGLPGATPDPRVEPQVGAVEPVYPRL